MVLWAGKSSLIMCKNVEGILMDGYHHLIAIQTCKRSLKASKKQKEMIEHRANMEMSRFLKEKKALIIYWILSTY